MALAHRISLVALTLVLSGLAGSAQATPQYLASPLDATGLLPAVGTKINSLGQVVGTTSSPYGGADQYFVASGGVVTLLGPVGYTGGHIDINDAGMIMYGDKLRHADGSTSALPRYSFGLNNLGHVSGRVETRSFTDYAAVFLPDGTSTLAAIAGRTNTGYDLNDFGVMVGAASGTYLSEPADFPPFRAVRYQNGEAQLLEAYGNGSGIARAVNNSGFAVGQTGGHAALWTPSGSLIDLGSMLNAKYGAEWGGDMWSAAYGINSFGEVVGAYGYYQGFLYSGGEIYDLDSLTASDGGIGPMGFDINDRHQIVAANVFQHTYILSLAEPSAVQPVTEPAPYAMFCAGLLAMAFLQSRKAKHDRCQ